MNERQPWPARSNIAEDMSWLETENYRVTVGSLRTGGPRSSSPTTTCRATAVLGHTLHPPPSSLLTQSSNCMGRLRQPNPPAPALAAIDRARGQSARAYR